MMGIPSLNIVARPFMGEIDMIRLSYESIQTQHQFEPLLEPWE